MLRQESQCFKYPLFWNKKTCQNFQNYYTKVKGLQSLKISGLIKTNFHICHLFGDTVARSKNCWSTVSSCFKWIAENIPSPKNVMEGPDMLEIFRDLWIVVVLFFFFFISPSCLWNLSLKKISNKENMAYLFIYYLQIIIRPQTFRFLFLLYIDKIPYLKYKLYVLAQFLHEKFSMLIFFFSIYFLCC